MRIIATSCYIIALYQFYSYFVQDDQELLEKYRVALQMTYQTFGSEKFSVQNVKDVIKCDLYQLTHPDLVEEDFYFDNHWMGLEFFWHKIAFNRKKLNPFQEFLKPVAFSFRTARLNQTFIEHFSLFQYISSIPKKEELKKKSVLTQVQNRLLEKYKMENYSSECLQSVNFLKPSYEIQNKNECLEIIRILKNKDYLVNGQPVKYLLKYNLHMQQGVFFLDDQNAEKLLIKTSFGEHCQNNPQAITVQEFINNPALLMKRAFTIRVYVLVASVHPPIAYFHERSMFQVCARPWKLDGQREYLRHLCNAAFAKGYFGCFKKQTQNPNFTCPYYPDVAGLEEHVPAPWFSNLTDMLIEDGLVNDSSWTYNYLYPQISQKVVQVLTDSEFHPDPRSNFLWYGIDFEIDTNLNIWLLDLNTLVSLIVATREREDMMTYLYRDSFKLVQHFTKQKYSQIKKFYHNDLLNKIKLINNNYELDLNEEQAKRKIFDGTRLTDENIQFENFIKIDFNQKPQVCN